MSTETTETVEEITLDISDEDFDKLSLDDYIASVEEESTSNKEEEDTTETGEETPTEEEESTEDDGNEEEKEEEEESEEVVDEDSTDRDVETNTDTTEDKDETENTSQEKVDTPSTEVDYKGEYEKILAPFRANNRDMQVKTVDEALTLMKMGANYNKKMAGLKPSLKIIKMLENNNLLDEEKLSFLIDLDKKDPEAVKKLVQDSKIDPLEIDTDTKADYKAKAYTVDDKEVELDQILEELRDTESFDKTIKIIGNKWDDDSKAILRDNPGVIKVINEQVSSGIYDKIATEVEHQRMLGRLTGISDLDAYKVVGDELHEKGAFNSGDSNAQTTQAKKVKKPKSGSTVVDRKKAASASRGKKPTKKVDADFNPLAMSDADFEKVSQSRFLT